MEAIICKDRDEFDALNALVFMSLKALEGAAGTQWTEAFVHPTTGAIAFTVEDRIKKYLLPGQLARVETLTDDWFPDPKDDVE